MLLRTALESILVLIHRYDMQAINQQSTSAHDFWKSLVNYRFALQEFSIRIPSINTAIATQTNNTEFEYILNDGHTYLVDNVCTSVAVNSLA